MESLVFHEPKDNISYIYRRKISLCAWCNETISISPLKASKDLISHGICDTCKEEHITNNYIESY
jgi:hypothetical protein